MNKIGLFFIGLLFLGTTSLLSKTVSQEMCSKNTQDFIFAGQECIQYVKADGDAEGILNIIVHGTWKKGTNILARYESFAEDLSMQTDITTIAVALPGYSGSSTNHLQALSNEKIKNQAATKPYIDFLAELVKVLKEKYDAKKINYIGHSAGAMMGATLTGYYPNLINTIVSVGGRYDIHKTVKDTNLTSVIDVMDRVNKEMPFLLIYGSKDTVSLPKVTKDFYKVALKKGLNVSIVEVKEGVHLDLDMSDTSVEAITELLDNE